MKNVCHEKIAAQNAGCVSVHLAHTKITFGYNFTTHLKELRNYNRNLFFCPPQK